MATKKISAAQNARTGSYTVRVPKSAVTGKFVSRSTTKGQLRVIGQPKKAS